MGYHHHCYIIFMIKFSQEVKHSLTTLPVQVTRRLIGENKFRFVYISARAIATRCCWPPEISMCIYP